MHGNDDRTTGTLHIVGTPIGNLEDLSPRAARVLASVDVIAAEDTRHTRGLLSSIGVKNAVLAFHEHNEDSRAAELLARLVAGESVALVCDAGMPTISDPGLKLVRSAREAGIEVLSVPGPSAVSAALSVGGLPTDRFVFEGFLPRRAAQRAARLEKVSTETRTIVFFESVHRLAEMLAALVAAFGDDRRAAIARELTKRHEATYGGTLKSLLGELGDSIPLRGEFVVLVAGADDAPSADEAEVLRIYALLREELAAPRAVRLTAAITGASRNDTYRLTRS